MLIIDFINKLLGKPDVTQTVTRRINGGLQQRWNAPGGFLMPPPPPVPIYPTPEEKPQTPMVSQIINNITEKPQVRLTPTTTSSIPLDYLNNWCGTTTNYLFNGFDQKDPHVVDHLPLKRMLMKSIPWVLDLTKVMVKKFHGTGGIPKITDGIISGQLEIYITVSPTHHSELMNPKIETEVREKLFVDLLPLLSCMFPNNSFMPPVIIFSPSHSETILEYVK